MGWLSEEKDNGTFVAVVTQGCIQMDVVLGKTKYIIMVIIFIYFGQYFVLFRIQNKHAKYDDCIWKVTKI